MEAIFLCRVLLPSGHHSCLRSRFSAPCWWASCPPSRCCGTFGNLVLPRFAPIRSSAVSGGRRRCHAGLTQHPCRLARAHGHMSLVRYLRKASGLGDRTRRPMWIGWCVWNHAKCFLSAHLEIAHAQFPAPPVIFISQSSSLRLTFAPWLGKLDWLPASCRRR